MDLDAVYINHRITCYGKDMAPSPYHTENVYELLHSVCLHDHYRSRMKPIANLCLKNEFSRILQICT